MLIGMTCNCEDCRTQIPSPASGGQKRATLPQPGLCKRIRLSSKTTLGVGPYVAMQKNAVPMKKNAKKSGPKAKKAEQPDQKMLSLSSLSRGTLLRRGQGSATSCRTRGCTIASLAATPGFTPSTLKSSPSWRISPI